VASREQYRLTPSDLPQLVNQLNFILSRIQDRLDQIEGVRGTSTIAESLVIGDSDAVVHGFNTENEV
jgi:hypothetical protein